MSEPTPIPGSVCAPRGFRAAGVAAGIKPSGNLDVALIVADEPCVAAGVFTRNQVAGAPVRVCKEHLAGRTARAIAVNSGCANVCTGERGLRDARRMAALAGELVGCAPEQVFVASTGVIGRYLPMERVEAGIRGAHSALRPDGDHDAARAIMTTDTRPKERAFAVTTPRGSFRLGGICKGSGMIAPNMATMLAFLTTDARVCAETLQAELRAAVDESFNCVTVDGDTSTSDTVLLLAGGASGVEVDAGLLPAFRAGLRRLCGELAREIARDGEGATRLVTIRVTGAEDAAAARAAGLVIGNSPLVKTAVFGNDPNWGRILCAAGYSPARLDPERLALTLCGIPLVRAGAPVAFDEGAVSRAMQAEEVLIEIDLGTGDASATIWTCDFSYDYVRINAEYTT